MVEPRWIVMSAVPEMPFSNERRLISRALQQLGKILLTAIDLRTEGRHTIDVVVGACEDRGSAGCTDRVSTKAVVEPHTSTCNPVQIRSFVDTAPIATHRVGCVVVRHDE